MCYVFGIYLIWERNNPDRLSFKDYGSNYVKYESEEVENPPIRIEIKEVGIDLPIFPANIRNGIWDTTTEGASYLVSSPVPGEKGNSIIYAHDWASLFGPLLNIRKDMVIKVVYEDKSRRYFKVKNIEVVSYNDSSILDSSNEREITLYTCTGFFDSKRFVAVAELQSDSDLQL